MIRSCEPMHYAFTPFLIPSLLAAIICWGMMFFLWRYRSRKGGSILLLLGTCASLWAVGYTLEIAAVPMTLKVFWAKMQYLVIPAIPSLYLVYTLYYTNRENWLLRGYRYVLLVFPVLMPILAFTTDRHGLLWKSYSLSFQGKFLTLVFTHGNVFWVFWVFCQFLLLLSTLVILRDLRRFPTLFQGQVRFLLVAVLAPWFTNALYVLKLNPVPDYDWTPFAFAISVTAFSWASLRYQFGTLMPIAHQIVFENLREGAIVLDPLRRIVEINQAAQKIVGLTAHAVGLPLAEALPGSSVWLRHFSAIAEMKTDFCLSEYPPLYYELQISPLHAQNLPQQGWLILLRDITPQKISEKRLQEAEAKYRALVENSPFVTYLFDDETPSLVSSQVEALLGFSVSELLASPTLWVELIHPDDRARVTREISHHRQTGETLLSEYRLLARNGQTVWVQDKAIRMQIAPQDSVFTMGVWQDITEQKIYSQQLIEKAEELKRSNIDLQQFAYAVSHDLQEPLRTVNAYIQLFQKRYATQVDDDALEIIHFIVDGAHRMKAMIEDLLEYSRVTTKGQSLTLTDCNQVFDRQLNYLLPLYERNEVQINSDPLPYLLVDEVQIGQLFRNLLSNALKYRSSVPPKIHISAKWIAVPPADHRKVTSSWVDEKDGAWLFAVKDNGIGIAPEFHERIFQIFQRLHTREEYPGNGIGLSLCKRIVERHGGEIWVDSTPGRGSTFYFTLPALGKNVKPLVARVLTPQ